ncbi:MAG TPA: GNAT family N-acetyltransferase [Fimbriimonadaceae bacterium]|nr:GNAT family N-acetyltransferase [Fimbriimonadaceae bacterium]
MIEARPILLEEADEFLQVLCEVFELDFARARPVFFSEPFYDLKRKWALFRSGKIVSVLTTVPLRFGWGMASGIAGVGTLLQDRGQGLGKQLINAALDDGTPAFLFAKRTDVYEEVGFKVIDSVIRGPFRPESEVLDQPLDFEEVQTIYSAWSELGDNRLRRDLQRWSYWKWHLRLCDRFGSGYICREPGMIREVIPGEGNWPVSSSEEFFGLKSMAESLGLPLQSHEHDMHLMALGTDRVPEMFLTDQF